MATDDEFFPSDSLDVFGSEVEALVVSVYKATVAGIEALDRQERARLKGRDLDSHPEVQQEISLWGDLVQAMKYHAGNMGLVSLIFLFDDWLAKRHKEVFPEKNSNNWKSRFEQLAEELQEGPLPLAELKDMVTARDSIIHHRGEAEFEYPQGTVHTVSERFLGFHKASGPERVAIEGSLLTDLASKLASQVNFWNEQKHKQKEVGPYPGP